LENSDFETIIDVGANVGEFSLAMLNFYQTRVIAVEPVDRTFQCLKENLAAFSNRSECFNLALSNNEEETNFFIAEDLENSSFIRPQVFQSRKVVQTETLEKFLEKRNIEKVDLLKMDAEGFEPEVLSGLGRLLHRIVNYTIDCSPERLGKSTTNEVRQFFILNQIPYREFTDKESGRVILVGGKNLKVD
jgi:FkbM family methyltransferase